MKTNMKNNNTIKGSFIVLLTMGLVQMSWAGYIVERRSGQPSFMDKTRIKWEKPVREYYDYDHLRVAQDNFILRFDSGKIIIVMDKTRSYYRNSIAGFCGDMDGMLKKMLQSPSFQQMKKEMAKMKPEQSAEPVKKSPVKVKKIGSGKIAGYQADHYQTSIAGQMTQDVWVATDSRLKGLNPKNNTKIEKISKQFEQCQKRFDKTMADMMGGFSSSSDLVTEAPDIDGFELKNSSQMHINEVASIKEADIPASRFEPPQGYKKVPISQIYQVDSMESMMGSEDDMADPAQQMYGRQSDADEAAEQSDENAKDAEKQLIDTMKKGAKKLLDKLW